MLTMPNSVINNGNLLRSTDKSEFVDIAGNNHGENINNINNDNCDDFKSEHKYGTEYQSETEIIQTNGLKMFNQTTISFHDISYSLYTKRLLCNKKSIKKYTMKKVR